jgi:shikimate 5-dehydrogenase
MSELTFVTRPPMPEQPHPIVIIGAGGIVNDAHLPAYHKAGFRVAGIFDRDQARAQSTASAFEISKVYNTLDEAIRMAREAIELYIEILAEKGEDIPSEEGILEYTLTIEAHA